ncbi:hypothetical protein A3A76_01220 [Candidatus Woesebacteria bacterium RIFCSPLOWO2_01_FULL_39_23]|nr:MAG: hypothetical protein A3E41_05330 [Candidatus Woesebacteria bacterium RIFCSPHIGHO2_12_FULL_38_9]OGM62900.1 MAG: hypothetical protein A3A76_01220 [Candidatus Woesebacteria bacterium RIFCSPLOWO2_01_FULL_39_23]
MSEHISHESITKSQGSSVVSAKTLGICLSLITIAVIALFVFKVPVNTLLLGGVLLACPLLHFWMMKDGEHKH